MIRLRNSAILNIEREKFYKFVYENIDFIQIKINNARLMLYDNSVIDLKIDKKTEQFIELLIEQNLCKSYSESIRFLILMYFINKKNTFSFEIMVDKEFFDKLYEVDVE